MSNVSAYSLHTVVSLSYVRCRHPGVRWTKFGGGGAFVKLHLLNQYGLAVGSLADASNTSFSLKSVTCKSSSSQLLWVRTRGNGRASELTEASLNLIHRSRCPGKAR